MNIFSDHDQPDWCPAKPYPGVIKLFSCSTQLSTTFILLINVNMPTIVGILTFISRINTTFECHKQGKIIDLQYLLSMSSQNFMLS